VTAQRLYTDRAAMMTLLLTDCAAIARRFRNDSTVIALRWRSDCATIVRCDCTIALRLCSDRIAITMRLQYRAMRSRCDVMQLRCYCDATVQRLHLCLFPCTSHLTTPHNTLRSDSYHHLISPPHLTSTYSLHRAKSIPMPTLPHHGMRRLHRLGGAVSMPGVQNIRKNCVLPLVQEGYRLFRREQARSGRGV
jgi:hypothetical protein